MRIHRWCRWRWVLAALVVLGLIGTVGGCTTVQNDVQARTRDALAANGLTGVTVTGTYRDVTLTGPESERAEATALAKALEATRQVTYVGSATGATPTAGPTSPSPSATTTPAPIGNDLKGAITAGALILTGNVPNSETKQLLVKAAQDAYGAANVTDSLTVLNGTPTTATAAAANTLIGLMPAFVSGITTGGFTLKDAALTVAGSCPGTTQLDALTAALTQAGVTSGVELALDPTAAVAMLRDVLAAQPIRFLLNSAQITPDSQPVLDHAVTYLAAAFAAKPDLQVEIGGFSSSDGDAAANLVLSQQRADSVRTALVNAGIPVAGLATVGRGVANPVADNATPEGRAQNRRIEFTIVGA